MTSTASSGGGQRNSCSEIPGNDVISADDRAKNDVTDSPTKPKVTGHSATDASSVKTTKRARRPPIKDTDCMRSAFSRCPEKIRKEGPGFQGNENYGFEYVKWMEEQTRKQ